MSVANLARRRLLKGAVALPAAALGGCVVTPYGPYYRPSSDHPGAKYKGAWCSGVAGPRSVVELPLAEGVTLTARAQRDYMERDRPDLPLRIGLTLPWTQPARFGSARLLVTESGKGAAIGGAPQVQVFRYAALATDAWIDPARVRPSGPAGSPLKEDEPHGSARVRVSMEPGYTPERLLVDGLAIVQDGGSTRMPAVAMSRPASKASARDYRSAALNASLQERAAACKRDTPKLACDNIVEHSLVSFLADEPTARWSGRWYVFGDGPAARIEGEVTFALRTPGRWRLASNALTVRDADGGSRTAVVSSINLALNNRIALDTPLFAGPVDGTGNAQLSIEVLLPGTASDFEVVLPELHVGARRIGIPPIRFERRTFDGGVEPFNC